MQRHLLDAPGDDPNAVCLDGTPGGFYLEKSRGDSSNSRMWVLHLQGGGWCYTVEQCVWRMRHDTNRSVPNALGSSTNWPLTMPSDEFGPVSSDQDTNPDFALWNHVYVKFCDGGSFAGDTSLQLPVGSKTVHYRGRRILQAVVKRLTRELRLGEEPGTEILLVGCSAGGLAVTLNADTIRSMLPVTVTKFKAISGSGFFLDAVSVEDVPVYETQMRAVFEMQALSTTLSAPCQAKHVGAEWRCVFAANAAPFVNADLFFIDSTVDAWQLGCIFGAQNIGREKPLEVSYTKKCFSAPALANCVSNYFTALTERCTHKQLEAVARFAAQFKDILVGTGVLDQRKNGCFVTSCVSHCGFSKRDWVEAKLGQGVSMQQAVGMWWRAFNATQAAVYLPCDLRNEQPYQCNPSCPPPIAPVYKTMQPLRPGLTLNASNAKAPRKASNAKPRGTNKALIAAGALLTVAGFLLGVKQARIVHGNGDALLFSVRREEKTSLIMLDVDSTEKSN